MIETICQGLKEDSFTVWISKLCRWFVFPVAHGVLQVHQGRVEGRSEAC